MKKRLMGLLLALLVALCGSARAAEFDAYALAEYATDERTDVPYIVGYWFSDRCLSSWSYETNISEYSFHLAWSDGAVGDGWISFGVMGDLDTAIPYVVLQGTNSEWLVLKTMTLQTGNASFLFSFSEGDENVANGEDNDGEYGYDYNVMVIAGSAGIPLLQAIRASSGALSLRLELYSGSVCDISLNALPPRKATENPEATAFDLFADGLTQAGFFDDPGILEHLRLLEDEGEIPRVQISGAAEGLLPAVEPADGEP